MEKQKQRFLQINRTGIINTMTVMNLKNHIAISDSGLLVNGITGEMYSVNRVGMLIIQGLKNNLPAEKIKMQIIEAYDVDVHIIEQTWDDFILLLRNFSLIENGGA